MFLSSSTLSKMAARRRHNRYRWLYPSAKKKLTMFETIKASDRTATGGTLRRVFPHFRHTCPTTLHSVSGSRFTPPCSFHFTRLLNFSRALAGINDDPVRATSIDRPDQLPLRNKLFVGNFGSMLALCSFPHIKISSRYRKLCRISSECITDEGYKCESELEKNDDPKRSVLFKFRSKSGNFNLSELVRELSHDFSI